MKTFNDIKVGDTIYGYYISFLGAGAKNHLLFFNSLRNNAILYTVTDIDDNYIYFFNKNSVKKRCKKINKTVQLSENDKAFNEYAFFPFSTYNYSSTKNPEILEQLQKDWNTVIHCYLFNYAKTISQRLYDELGITNDNYKDNEQIVIEKEIQEKEVIKEVKVKEIVYINKSIIKNME